MELRSRRTLVAIGAAGALAVGAGAAYAAQSGGDGDGERGPAAALADVAARVGVSEQELRDAFQAEALERLDQAVADGRLTEEQAAEIRERIESGEGPGFRAHHGPHHGPGGPVALGLETAAGYLELEPEALLEELRSGRTLADVAEEQGKSVEGLEDVLVAEARERIHEIVTEGFPARPGHSDDFETPAEPEAQAEENAAA
jgi:hypothetical protein